MASLRRYLNMRFEWHTRYQSCATRGELVGQLASVAQILNSHRATLPLPIVTHQGSNKRASKRANTGGGGASGGGGSSADNSSSGGQGSAGSKPAKKKCSYCKKSGHKSHECWKRSNDEKRGNDGDRDGNGPKKA